MSRKAGRAGSGLEHRQNLRRENADLAPAPPGHQFESVTRLTLGGKVTEVLVTEIVGGAFNAGDQLPAEMNLATQFGVSRQVIREAIGQLTLLGLVTTRQGAPSRIAPNENWNEFAPALLEARQATGAYDDILLELLELRRMIELDAAALAAERATASELVAMSQSLSDMDRCMLDPLAFSLHDLRFHQLIMLATRNRLLPLLFQQLRPLLAFGREISARSRPDGMSTSQAGHKAVLIAIEARSLAALEPPWLIT